MVKANMNDAFFWVKNPFLFFKNIRLFKLSIYGIYNFMPKKMRIQCLEIAAINTAAQPSSLVKITRFIEKMY